MIDRDTFKTTIEAAQRALLHADRWRRALEPSEHGESQLQNARIACTEAWGQVHGNVMFWDTHPDGPETYVGSKHEWAAFRLENPELFAAASRFKVAVKPVIQSFLYANQPASSPLHRSEPDWGKLDEVREALDSLRGAMSPESRERSPIIASQREIANAIICCPTTTGLLGTLQKEERLRFIKVPGKVFKAKIWFTDPEEHEHVRRQIELARAAKRSRREEKRRKA